MLSLTACVWDFQNNALWDTHKTDPIGVGNEGGVESSPCLTVPQHTFTQKSQLVVRVMDSAFGRGIRE